MGLDPARVVADLRELRELTEDEHGAQRVAWTETWAAARAWLRDKLAPLPVSVDVDEAGNLWATLRGVSERSVLIGGHLDSVPNGGWLDGALDTVAGLEVLRRLCAGRPPPLTVSLVDWADEEGARFGRSLLGSGFASGSVAAEEVAGLRDRDGTTLAEAVGRHGVDLGSAARSGRRLAGAAAYLELHIEQGPVLEREGLPLGVVTGTAGVERHRLRFTGEAVQAGAFPMDDRRDALVAGAQVVLAVRAAAPDGRSRSTVGDVRVQPGIATAVPGDCELLIDQRHTDPALLAEMWRDVRDAAERAARDERVELAVERVWHIDPIPFNRELVRDAEEIIEALAGRAVQLFSGALHDAAEMALAGVPSVMLFVRSAGGLSHNPAEDSSPEDIELGVRALDRLATRTLDRLASSTHARPST